MNGQIVPITRTPPTFGSTLPGLEASVAGVRLRIAEATTLAEAYELYQQVRMCAQLLTQLTDHAAEKCDALLKRR